MTEAKKQSEEAMEKLGKKRSEVRGRGTSLEVHGFSIAAIKEWREREREASHPAGLEDFYSRHDLCFTCRCTGVLHLGLGEDGERMWDICDVCGGTGNAAGGGRGGKAATDETVPLAEGDGLK